MKRDVADVEKDGARSGHERDREEVDKPDEKRVERRAPEGFSTSSRVPT